MPFEIWVTVLLFNKCIGVMSIMSVNYCGIWLIQALHNDSTGQSYWSHYICFLIFLHFMSSAFRTLELKSKWYLSVFSSFLYKKTRPWMALHLISANSLPWDILSFLLFIITTSFITINSFHCLNLWRSEPQCFLV